MRLIRNIVYQDCTVCYCGNCEESSTDVYLSEAILTNQIPAFYEIAIESKIPCEGDPQF